MAMFRSDWSDMQFDSHLCFGGGFKDFFDFHPYLGEDSDFDSYFSNGLKPPTSHLLFHHVVIDFKNCRPQHWLTLDELLVRTFGST